MLEEIGPVKYAKIKCQKNPGDRRVELDRIDIKMN
jgi:hypothetical protein